MRRFLSGMWHSSGKVGADFYTGPQGAQNFDFVDFSVGLVEFVAEVCVWNTNPFYKNCHGNIPPLAHTQTGLL